MKKFRPTLFVIVALALVLVACGGAPNNGANNDMNNDAANNNAANDSSDSDASDSGLPDLGGREVTVAIENAYLPFNYVSLETGEPGGWDYDVIDAMCALVNCVPVYEEVSWDVMIQSVADGQYDMAADGITITSDRGEIVDFSMGYVAIDQRLLVRVGEDRFDSIEAFAADDSLTLGTQVATTNYETAVEYLSEDRIQAFEQFPFAVQALISGDVDAVIIDETAGLGYQGENADALALIGPSIVSQELGFIYPQGSELVAAFDAALQSMMDDGSLQEINAFYFGPTFDVSYDDIGDGAYAEEEESGLPDLGGREVTVAIENAYLPFNYVSLETGEPGGWDYDVIDAMCVLVNCVPVYEEVSWDVMIQSVADGQYDMAADGITITETRAEIVDFSIGYVAIDQRLLVRVGEDRFDSIEAFAADDSLSLGTQVATTNYETAVEYLSEDRIQAFEQFPFAVQALISGDVDAVIIDETAGLGYQGENADALVLIGPSIVSQALGFIYPQGSELVAAFDAALQAMMADGSLQEINAFYFGPTFDVSYDDIGDGAYAED